MAALARWLRRREERAEVWAWMDRFIADTRVAVHVREADGVLMIRPEKTLGVNPSGAAILRALYRRDGEGARVTLARLSRELGVHPHRLQEDARQLLETIAAMMRQDFSPRDNLRFVEVERHRVVYPVLAEIALTYACQNRCAFCYAASPHRAGEHEPMTTEQVRRVMDRIWHEAHVPSLSFTGGEATLRPDLPALIEHGSELGFRVNLISNGIRCADPEFTARLVDAGLDSAQISIEAGDAALHDRLVGRDGAHAATVAAVGRLREAGVHVHTNTTLCRANVGAAPALIRFLAREVGTTTLSMNLLIRTGLGLDDAAGPLSYTELAPFLPGLQRVADDEGMTLVWYSPLPYCIANPVLLGQGAKSCACVRGILSVDPAGDVLPCSSFQQGIGSLLDTPFEEIFASDAARWWRERRYVPPPCRECDDVDLCAGACPLYWDAAGGFSELPCPGADDEEAAAAWRVERARGGSYGVPMPRSASWGV